MKVPKLNKITALNNELRYPRTHVWIQQDYIVAVSDYCLVWYARDNNNFFLPSYFNGLDLSTQSIIVPTKEWAKIAGKEVSQFQVNDDNIFVQDSKGNIHNLDYAYYNTEELPDWKSVIPINLDTGDFTLEEDAPSLFTVNLKLLNAIREALPSEGHRIKLLQKNKAIIIESHEYPLTQAGAILMPIMNHY